MFTSRMLKPMRGCGIGLPGPKSVCQTRSTIRRPSLPQLRACSSRRDVLQDMAVGLALLSSPLIVPSQVLAKDNLSDGDPFVLPALSVGQYMDRITAARPAAIQQLTDSVQAGNFKEAAESLVLYPFDDVAQSAFYLPWAMLRVDEDRAVKVKVAYKAFAERLVNFERLCREASSYRAEDSEVDAALSSMNSSLDSLLTSVSTA